MNTGEEEREEAAECTCEVIRVDAGQCSEERGADGKQEVQKTPETGEWGGDDEKSAVELSVILHPSVISLITHPQGLSAVVKTTSMLPPPCVVRALRGSPPRTPLATPPSR